MSDKFKIPEDFDPRREDADLVFKKDGSMVNEERLKDIASRWKGFDEQKRKELLKMLPNLKDYIQEE